MGLTIGKVAKKADVNIETIRYYERIKLIPSPPRSASGYRQYPVETVALVRFIKRTQGLGFSLGEIADLLALRVGPDGSCVDIRERVEEKIRSIRKKITALERMKETLEDLALQCRHKQPSRECAILKILDPLEENS